MARSHNRLKCPKCGSKESVYCLLASTRIFHRDLKASADYTLHCHVCGHRERKTVFSEYSRRNGERMHGLKCPFCGRGRKAHRFRALKFARLVGVWSPRLLSKRRPSCLELEQKQA